VTVPSVVQRSPTECGVSECDLETSTKRKPGPTRAVEQRIKEKCNVNKQVMRFYFQVRKYMGLFEMIVGF